MGKPGICIDRARSIHTLALGQARGKTRREIAAGKAGTVELAADSDGERQMAVSGNREAQGSRRPRQQARRCHRVEFSLTADEFAALEGAAGRAGLARGAYAAQVVLGHATGSGAGPEAPDREALRELVRAAGLAWGAYAAQVVLGHVNGSAAGPEARDREALRELVRAAGLAHKIGVLLNQAVAKLKEATGTPVASVVSARARP